MNKITFPKSLILTLVGILLVTFSAAAGTSLEGVVKDPTGRPIKGADVRIEAKNFSKIVKTDANGRYVCNGLGVATYKATLVTMDKSKHRSPTPRRRRASQLNSTSI